MTLDLADFGHIHFVGIAGAGMSGLARYAQARGHQVSGSDRAPGDGLADLRELGVSIRHGHSAAGIRGADVVVVSSAVPAENAEIVAAVASGIPVVKRAELLAAIMNPAFGIAVAGTHGKSTTSALIGHILVEAGCDPTILIGANSNNLRSNARVGGSGTVVVEADEYDASFLRLEPRIGVIGNVEADHLDFYGSRDSLGEAFASFAGRVRDVLVIGADDPGAMKAAEKCATRVVTFGLDRGDWRAIGIREESGLTGFEITRGRGRWPAKTSLAGAHNVRNILASLSVCVELDVQPEEAIGALETFTGLERRLEIKGEMGGVLVVDDYAHHPSEIRVSLEAVRGRFPDRRLLLIFQPHTYSRTANLFDDFAEVLTLADRTYLMDIYPSRETDSLGMHSRDLAEAAASRGDVVYSGLHQETAEMVLQEVRPGDLVVTMGAGDVNEVAERVLRERGGHEQIVSKGGGDGLGTVERSTGHGGRTPAALGGEVVGRLKAAGVKRVSAQEPMSRHTSWRIGGPADFLCVVEDQEQLRGAISVAQDCGLPWLVIGGGNNILVSDDGIDGVVILNRLRGISVQGSPSNGHAELVCGAGVFFAKAAQYSAQRNFTGMEWGIAVPGTVGGGVVNNAGAHTSDVARSLVWTTILDAQGRDERLDPEQLDYRYRHSMLKTGITVRSELVVTSCAFRLEPDQPGAALSRLEEFRRHRIQTQPVKEASAGSSFTNPEGDSAGSLIDRAGLKGHRIGGAQISPLHANFMLNVGKASAGDVVRLLLLSRRTVEERFGVTLVPEIQLAGRWSDEVVASLSEPVR